MRRSTADIGSRLSALGLMALLFTTSVRAQGTEMSNKSKAPADSVYLQIQRQLVNHGYYFLRVDPRAHVMVVRMPKDSTILEAKVIAEGDSSDAKFIVLRGVDMVQAMTALVTVAGDATLDKHPAPPAAPTAAAPAPGVSAGSWTYSANVQLKDQFQDVGPRTITVSRAANAGVDAWLVTAAMRFDQDPFIDSVWMRATDLAPLARHAVSGRPPNIGFVLTGAVRDTLFTGTLTADGKESPLSVRLGVHGFLNYYSLRAALATMPLSANWSGDVSALELGKEPSFFPLKLRVTGDERIENPAGLFDCWILHVTGPGIDETYWVSKSGQFVVRAREPIGAKGATMQLDLMRRTGGA